jgi:YhcH/YjgK/YiaL family protein
MIIDLLNNWTNYEAVHKRMKDAFLFLQATDLNAIGAGTHLIDTDDLYAIVQEYETLDIVNEQMESHRKYIDLQYMIHGTEMVGYSSLKNQAISKDYQSENDFMLYADAPSFFTIMEAGTFMIFFPTDLHMPCIKINEPALVKKIVIKMKI